MSVAIERPRSAFPNHIRVPRPSFRTRLTVSQRLTDRLRAYVAAATLMATTAWRLAITPPATPDLRDPLA